MRRYDVIYSEHGPTIDAHFCRIWENDVGCYGTNPHHGLSWNDAVKEYRVEMQIYMDDQIAYLSQFFEEK